MISVILGPRQVRRSVKHSIGAPDTQTERHRFRSRPKTLFSPNDDETMSLPPALLNLVDQAKDALWAVTACIFHPSARVKINGRTCAYPFQFVLRFHCPRLSDVFSSFVTRLVWSCDCCCGSRFQSKS
jgi:hypothetical protein